jgi:hypothetical protein
VIVLEFVAAVSVPFWHAAFFAAGVETPVVLIFVIVMPAGRLSAILKPVKLVSLGATIVILKRVSPVPFAIVVVFPNAIVTGVNIFVTLGGDDALTVIGMFPVLVDATP